MSRTYTKNISMRPTRSRGGCSMAASLRGIPIPDSADAIYMRDVVWKDTARRMRRDLKECGVSDFREFDQLVFEFSMAAREAGFLLGLSTAYEVLRSARGGAL